MADVARCLCPRTNECPIHGPSAKDPQRRYLLTENDRKMLRSFRIAVVDDDDVRDTYQADLKERR